jgi:hypothetical protein
MLEELKAENPAEELLKLVNQWMIIREGHPDEYNVLRKADITINVSIAASLIDIVSVLREIRIEMSRGL